MILQGDLREFSVADLMRILEHGHKTGRLVLETPSLQGELLWAGGKLTGATLGPLQGEEAVHPWWIWPEGRFTFQEGGETEASSIHTSLADLLQEGLRRQEAWAPLAELAPGWGPDSPVRWAGEPDPSLPLPAEGASARDLIYAAGGMTATLAQSLTALVGEERVQIEPTPAGALHNWFQRLTAEVYAGFAAISGFKLLTEFDRHLSGTIDGHGWHLAWSGGKITDKAPFARTSDEQLALYEAFLREVAGFIVPVHGQALLIQATERAGKPNEPLAEQLKQRWLAMEPAGSKTDE